VRRLLSLIALSLTPVPSAQIAPLPTPVVPVTHEQKFLDVAADALFEIDEEQGLHKVMSLAPSLK